MAKDYETSSSYKGSCKIDVTQGEAIEVSGDSFYPGYDISSTLEQGYANESDLKKGYIESGKATGE